jgi:hypothetical protein
VETGDGEDESGEEPVEGEEAGGTRVEGDVAPCTDPARGDPPSSGEDGVAGGNMFTSWLKVVFFILGTLTACKCSLDCSSSLYHGHTLVHV